MIFGLAGLAFAGRPLWAASYPAVDVFRDPGCGCCEKWVEHLRAAGFTVTITDDPDRQARRASLGIGDDQASCHTAVIGPYAIEGHVPAREILRFLDERPPGAIGLSVPGMPMGSPGMGEPGTGEPYDVLLLFKGKPPQVYAAYPG